MSVDKTSLAAELPLFESELKLSNRFVDHLPGEAIAEDLPSTRQVENACYSSVLPTATHAPQLLACTEPLAKQLGLSESFMASEHFLNLVSGNALEHRMQPFAMCYGGHQFGHWAGQLGDGRAINLGGILGRDDVHYEWQLKGAGPTPYSRRADGRAVLRSSIREFVCSEAMYHLGVPTTRALSLSLTGDQVLRDMFYDGRSAPEPGAVVCRVSPSFIRFGSFEIFAARQDNVSLEQLLAYVIRYHYPHLWSHYQQDKAGAALLMFQELCEKSCDLLVHWMRLGFVHGVLNTDNMSIIGETIDYGPYGWLDNMDPTWTPNTTDREHRRYRYENQPHIVQWNLLQLANALYPIVRDADALEVAIRHFSTLYDERWSLMMMQKLGLSSLKVGDLRVQETASVLSDTLLSLMQTLHMDMTLFFRYLSELDIDDPQAEHRCLDALPAFSYLEDSRLTLEAARHQFAGWLSGYLKLRREEVELAVAKQCQSMQAVNPVMTPRNFLLQDVIHAAEKGDYLPLSDMVEALQTPYADSVLTRSYHRLRPKQAKTAPGCSMLSCSS